MTTTCLAGLWSCRAPLVLDSLLNALIYSHINIFMQGTTYSCYISNTAFQSPPMFQHMTLFLESFLFLSQHKYFCFSEFMPALVNERWIARARMKRSPIQIFSLLLMPLKRYEVIFFSWHHFFVFVLFDA